MRLAASEKKTTVGAEGQGRRFLSGVGVPVSNVLSVILKLLTDGWGTSQRHLAPTHHVVGKRLT
jgi:hypothetical protein